MWTLLLLFIIRLCASLVSSVSYSPDLDQNVLNISYGINFKYNGQLHHNIDRIWVVTKFQMIKPSLLKFPQISLSDNCERFVETLSTATQPEVEELKFLCESVAPLLKTFKAKERYYQQRAMEILSGDIYQALHGHRVRNRRSFGAPTNFSLPSAGTLVRPKRGIFSAFLPAIAGLANIAVESLGSFLNSKRNTALQKGLHAMKTDSSLYDNIIKGLDSDNLLYGKFSFDSLDAIADQLEHLHAKTSTLENMLNVVNATKAQNHFIGETLTGRIRFMHLLQVYFQTVSEKHIRLYEELIRHLLDVLRAIRTLSRGHIPVELFPPALLGNITEKAVKMIRNAHPEYSAVLEHVTKYYDLQVVTFGLDSSDDLVVTFPVFVHDRTQKPLNLYEIETVMVPIHDENKLADSYSRIQVHKPYFATNKGYYIELTIPELRQCKKVQASYLCEELFLVKHQSAHSCPSAIYYNTSSEHLYQFCKFNYFYNTTVTPSVLDGGNKILLANMLTSKKLVCDYDNELAKPIPTFDYVLVNRNILCNCHLDAEYMYLLSSLSSCLGNRNQLTMTFTLNFAFLDLMKDLWNGTLTAFPHQLTSHEQILPIALEDVKYNSMSQSLQSQNPPQTPTTLVQLRNALHQMRMMQNYQHFSFSPRHNLSPRQTQKNVSIFTSYVSHIFYMIASIVITIIILPQLYLFIKHKKLQTLVGALALYRTGITNVQAMPTSNPINPFEFNMCYNPVLSTVATIVTILGITICAYKYLKPLTCIKGYKYSRTCTIYMFITHKCRYVPIKLKTSTGLLLNFKIEGNITQKEIRYNPNLIWDTVHVDWSKVKITYNGNSMEVPQDITIPILDKIRFRNIFNKHPSQIYFMIKQGNSWYTLKDNKPNTHASIDPQMPLTEIQTLDV